MWRRLASAAAMAVQSGSRTQACTMAGPAEVQPAMRRFFATNSTDVFNVHHDTPENNHSTTFDFTEKNYERVAEIISQYPPNYKASAVIPLLDLVQQQAGGWISLASMNRVAKILDMSEIRVYEVGTFYSMYNRGQVGKYYIQVCGTTPCRLCGAEGIAEALEGHLGIKIGQTTKDGNFTLGEMECMGSCANAPMIVVADYSRGVDGYSYNYYEDLTPADAIRIAETYKAGKIPEKIGSVHRGKAEPMGHSADGKWHAVKVEPTLSGTPSGPFCRELKPLPPPPPPAAK